MSAAVASDPSVRTSPPAPQALTPRPALWTHAANAALGAWVATSAPTAHPVSPALAWSDGVTGALIVALSVMGCSPRFRWAPWAVAGLGLWLTAAPLVFWAPSAAAYATGNLVGALVFAFAVLVPGTPGTRDQPGPDVPPGWAYNPSAWPQRAGIIALAFTQFFAARYMAAHQLGHVPHAWDPLFGDGTDRVLNSDVSKSFPVSDAGLGAFSYLLEALTGFLGGTRRWRTMPWAVLLFGTLVVPVGVVSIVLVVLQPLVVGAWCGLCLFTAVATVLLVAPAVDEVLATGQVLLRARDEGRSVWRTLWHGDEGGAEVPYRPGPLYREVLGGMELNSVPWNLVAGTAVGAWLMVSPSVVGSTGAAAGSTLITGALVVTFAVIGFGEAARAARLVCVPLGAWLIVAPWVLSGASPTAQWADGAAGVVVILLSLRRGPIEGRFGGWDRYVV